MAREWPKGTPFWERITPATPEDPGKRCSRCKRWLTWDSFYKSKTSHDGRRGECKACGKAYNDQYRGQMMRLSKDRHIAATKVDRRDAKRRLRQYIKNGGEYERREYVCKSRAPARLKLYMETGVGYEKAGD